jgi:hypothetical protein
MDIKSCLDKSSTIKLVCKINSLFEEEEKNYINHQQIFVSFNKLYLNSRRKIVSVKNKRGCCLPLACFYFSCRQDGTSVLSWASESDRSPGEPIYFERRSLHHSQAILQLLLAASKVTLS